MNPLVHNFVCPQGATFNEAVLCSENGTPFNLTGYTAKMQVRETYQTTHVAKELTHTAGLTLGGTAGTIIINISSTDTAALTPKKYVYDLLITTGTTVIRVIEGEFIVTPGVTR